MIRYAIFILPLTLYPTSTLSESVIPSWCCPVTCQVVDGNTDNALLIDERGQTALSRNGQTIPFSRDLFRGIANDGLTRVCIGYTDFGDPEIKCLFSPPALS